MKFKDVKKIILNICVILIVVTMTGTISNVSAADYSKMKIIRIGLKYGSNAVNAANSYAVNGFTIGYFDENDYFNELYSFSNRFVTFAKDKNMYIKGNTVSDSSFSGAVKIGSYHLMVDGDFSSITEALNFANNATELLKNNGINSVVFPAYSDGVFKVKIGEYSSMEEATKNKKTVQNLLGYKVSEVGNIKNAITVIDMNDYFTVFEFNSSSYWPAVKPIQKEGTETVLLKNGTSYYHGYFEFKRITGEDINFISVLTLDEYVRGVLPYEMSPSWPLEALKAQAVSARTYAVMGYNKHKSQGFNLCSDTDCQVYKGASQENDRIRTAVSETSGQLLTYEGKPIQTFYHSSNGGYTESVKNVWGSEDKPYYTPVPDTFEDLDKATNGRWSSTVTGAELGEYLRSKKYDIGNVVNAYVSEFTNPAGNVYSVTFVDTTGKKVVISKCDNVRIKLSKFVKSPRFKITSGMNTNVNIITSNGNEEKTIMDSYVISKDGIKTLSGNTDITVKSAEGQNSLQSGGNNTFTFTGTGWGHNVGMSQYGALGMAKQGYTYDFILTYYFQGTKVEFFPELV